MQDESVTHGKNEPLWKKRIWWISVGGMAVLSSTRLIIGAFEAPEGSQLRYSLFGLLGGLTALVFGVLMSFAFWLAGHSRSKRIRADTHDAPVVYVAGLAEDGDEVLSKLGATYSFPRPKYAVVSFGASPQGLLVYRRFSHRIAFFRADRVADVLYERRVLASGPEHEVMTFLVEDETGSVHRLSFSIFSPGKMFVVAYSRNYKEKLLHDFREVLGVKDRAAESGELPQTQSVPRGQEPRTWTATARARPRGFPLDEAGE